MSKAVVRGTVSTGIPLHEGHHGYMDVGGCKISMKDVFAAGKPAVMDQIGGSTSKQSQQSEVIASQPGSGELSYFKGKAQKRKRRTPQEDFNVDSTRLTGRPPQVLKDAIPSSDDVESMSGGKRLAAPEGLSASPAKRRRLEEVGDDAIDSSLWSENAQEPNNASSSGRPIFRYKEVIFNPKPRNAKRLPTGNEQEATAKAGRYPSFAREDGLQRHILKQHQNQFGM
ncbi:hypothetical protein FRC17_006955 [Serendipita sp. 399]|nr:hypothetical protein FRC17_006955 [Serendipita sp. 399]